MMSTAMKTTEGEYVSERTGEVIPIRELSYVKMSKEAMDALWIVGNAAVRVYVTLVSRMNRHNFVKLNRVDLSEYTGYTRLTVTRALEELEDKNMIWYEHSRCMVNPVNVWRGRDGDERVKAENIFYDKLRKKRIQDV